jgi:hypothetical protein
VPHDFRPRRYRNFEQRGISRSVAMGLTGHKTEAVYRRYAIVSESDHHGRRPSSRRRRGHNSGHNRLPGEQVARDKTRPSS